MNAAAMIQIRGEAQKVQEAVWPGMVVIGSRQYQVAVTRGTVDVSTPTGGYVKKQTLTVSLNKTLCPVCPKVGEVVIHERAQYGVNETGGDDVNAVAWVLRCVEWNR